MVWEREWYCFGSFCVGVFYVFVLYFDCFFYDRIVFVVGDNCNFFDWFYEYENVKLWKWRYDSVENGDSYVEKKV